MNTAQWESFLYPKGTVFDSKAYIQRHTALQDVNNPATDLLNAIITDCRQYHISKTKCFTRDNITTSAAALLTKFKEAVTSFDILRSRYYYELLHQQIGAGNFFKTPNATRVNITQTIEQELQIINQTAANTT